MKVKDIEYTSINYRDHKWFIPDSADDILPNLNALYAVKDPK